MSWRSTRKERNPVQWSTIRCHLHADSAKPWSMLSPLRSIAILTYNILYPNQHGFQKGLSCETQLISTLQDWTLSSDHKRQTGVVLLDFSKVFDKVSHRKLLWKVDFHGIRGKTKAWIAAFLADRTQRGFVNAKASSNTDLLSGVPQGTVLGPLLFLLYIMDISSTINSPMCLFVDDSLVYREIKSPANHLILQDDINKLYWVGRAMADEL